MSAINTVTEIGRLTRDFELRYLPSGQAVAKAGFANSKKWKDKDTGEWKEKPMFIDIVIWGKPAETAAKHCKKGRMIAIEGELELEEWIDNETGKKRSKHVIAVSSFEFLERKGGQETEPDSESPRPAKQDLGNGISVETEFEEIPFNRG